MDLRLVEYFVAVADGLSFSRAAEQLYVTTPTVSAGIRRLERQLGVALFVRTSRSVRLTGDGEALLGDARQLLDDAERLRDRASTLAGDIHLVAGTFWGLGARCLEEAEGHLKDSHHRIRLDLRSFGWDDPTGGLRSRRADVAVVPGPSDIDHLLCRFRLWTEARVAILPAGHPLAGQDEVRLADLDEIGWARFPEVDSVAHPWWRLDHVRGGPPRETGRTHETPHELLLAIRNGVGISTTVASFREQFTFDGVRLVPLVDVPPVPVDLAFRRERQIAGAQALTAAARLVTASRRADLSSM